MKRSIMRSNLFDKAFFWVPGAQLYSSSLSFSCLRASILDLFSSVKWRALALSSPSSVGSPLEFLPRLRFLYLLGDADPLSYSLVLFWSFIFPCLPSLVLSFLFYVVERDLRFTSKAFIESFILWSSSPSLSSELCWDLFILRDRGLMLSSISGFRLPRESNL